MALSPFIGLELPTVFKLHSAFAGVCGALASLAPSFFGQVFPDLASPVGRLAHTCLAHAVLPARLPCLPGCPSARRSQPGELRLSRRSPAYCSRTPWPSSCACTPYCSPHKRRCSTASGR